MELNLKHINNPEILFIKRSDFNARTVKNDLEILTTKYFVDILDTKVTISGLISQFLTLLIWGWYYGIYYIWFADYHSFLPAVFAKIYGKKLVVCLGGYDIEEVHTSKNIRQRIRKFCVNYTLKKSDKLFPVSNYLKNEIKL